MTLLATTYMMSIETPRYCRTDPGRLFDALAALRQPLGLHAERARAPAQTLLSRVGTVLSPLPVASRVASAVVMRKMTPHKPHYTHAIHYNHRDIHIDYLTDDGEWRIRGEKKISGLLSP